MFGPSPKIVTFEKHCESYDYKDAYSVKVEFTDLDTGEDLIADFSLWEWYKAPSHIEHDNKERLMNSIVTVAGRES